MNLPNRLTISRIILTVVIIIILTFPFYQVGIEFPMWTWRFKEVIEVDSRYIISGILFVIASFTDFLDGKIARKRGLVTDFGKFIDAIADKVLVNSVLILLATNAIISPIIPVVIIFRDTIVDSIRMMAANKGVVVAAGKAGKAKTAIMMVGLTLTFFYNLPFELIPLRVSDFLLAVAAILSVISGIKYYIMAKPYLKDR